LNDEAPLESVPAGCALDGIDESSAEINFNLPGRVFVITGVALEEVSSFCSLLRSTSARMEGERSRYLYGDDDGFFFISELFIIALEGEEEINR
jgi:hypothetical protein